jgi:hypothetical protein
MTDHEGSVSVDEGQALPSYDNDDSTEESQEVEETQSDSEEESQSEEAQEETPELTEKGTKLDPDPMSALNQQLANERRMRQQYENVLQNPDNLKRYAQEFGLTLAEAKAEVKEQQQAFTPDKFQTVDDIAKTFNEFSSTITELREENKKLSEHLSGLSSESQIERVTNSISKDISTVREKYPELNPKSPNYDQGLEKEIGELYHELDYDQSMRGYRGNHSLANITDRIMRAAGRARNKGSQEAQTQVKVKQAGRVVTSGKKTDSSTKESTNPSTVIAQRISKALQGK